MTPDVRSHFIYQGERYEVAWFDLAEKSSLGAIEWQQVYAIGDANGKVPIVHYANPSLKPDNLPGGKTQQGETPEETLTREIKEELNMRVVAWQPLGYQKVTAPDGRTANQLRVYAKLVPLGLFADDPGGDVVGHRLVELAEVNSVVHYGEVGERLVRLAGKHFEKQL